MKPLKMMLLGIGLLLFSIFCRIMGIGYVYSQIDHRSGGRDDDSGQQGPFSIRCGQLFGDWRKWGRGYFLQHIWAAVIWLHQGQVWISTTRAAIPA